jgi:TldD protein
MPSEIEGPLSHRGRSRYFVESRDAALLAYRTGHAPENERTSFAGIGATDAEAESSCHEWLWMPESSRGVVGKLPRSIAATADELRSRTDGEIVDLEPAARALAEPVEAQRATLDLRIRYVDQRVALVTGDETKRDRRSFIGLGIRVGRPADEDGTKPFSIYRSRLYATFEDLFNQIEALKDLVNQLALGVGSARPVSAEPGTTTVVLAAGTAAPFFHEVCGHPLEGDIVSTGTSYLGSLLDERVAPEFVTVVDDPGFSPSPASYAIDDEGSAAQPVYLLKEGVVADMLLDRRTAERFGRAPNGHGRRLDFRFPALPRMAHTAVSTHEGSLDEVVEPLRRGLLANRLGLRHMDLATGDFSFYVLEGRQIEAGKVGEYVRPAIVRGRALAALAAIDAVGDDRESFAPTGGGCGKLDQGPLFVSFASPTVRIRELDVQPWL